MQYRSKIELWRIATVAHHDYKIIFKSNQFLEIGKPARVILEMRMGDENRVCIRCSDISKDGHYLAISDHKQTYVYNLTFNDTTGDSIKVQKSLTLPSSTCLVFNPSHPHLLLSTTPDNTIHIHNILKPSKSSHIQTHLDNSNTHKRDIDHICISPNGKWLAVTMVDEIKVINLENKTVHAELPPFKRTSYCSFSEDSEKLLIGLTWTLQVFDIENKRLSSEVKVRSAQCVGLFSSNDIIYYANQTRIYFFKQTIKQSNNQTTAL
jgi:hypothetical protein